MKQHNNLIKISDFSRLCNISKQTLIYYHKIELFFPYFINEKGYRFYTLEQHNILSLIKTLKEIGTPLEEIKEYINKRNSKEFLLLLERNKQKVEEQIKSLESISKSINEGMDRLRLGEKNRLKNETPKIEYLEKEYIDVSEISSTKKSLDIVHGINELNDIAKNLKINFLNIHAIVKKENILNNNFEISYLYINHLKKSKNSIEKPKGKYAVIYHQGSFEDTFKSYSKLLAFIKKENYEIKSDSYEETVLDFKTENTNNFLIKISINIK
ncbi:MerR family transcriptional regulator [uncultured Cetobacterium sp.]|uniref:MerR family transcriptional regulator n=1 Tax=uncultured Cetobacterium sp. TaxID=527638 RepID=UPI002618AB0D|nr:MerR family transcriptional regulator [uncultured Cetobacterium sp.]